MTKKQKNFLLIYEKQKGHISNTCKAIGMARKSYYLWMDHKNTQFREAIEAIDESFIDFAESKHREKINRGFWPAIRFFLETKGKKRGYGPSQEIDLTGDFKPIEFIITKPKEKND